MKNIKFLFLLSGLFFLISSTVFACLGDCCLKLCKRGRGRYVYSFSNKEDEIENSTTYPANTLKYDKEDDVFFIQRSDVEKTQNFELPIFTSLGDNESESYKIAGQVPHSVPPKINWKTQENWKNFTENLIENNTIYPFNAVGCLVSQNSFRYIYGSGVLIEPGYVLTAAHNIYKEMTNGDDIKDLFVDAISFYPQLDGGTAPAALHGETVVIYKNFRNHNTSKQDKKSIDIALVKLDDKSREYAANFPLKNKNIKKEKITNVTVLGYPGRDPYTARHMVYQDLEVQSISSNGLIHYKGSTTYSGESGGAIYYRGENNKEKLVGIHTRILEDGEGSEGVFLNKEKQNKIKFWINSFSTPK